MEYIAHEWQDEEIITAEKANNLEQAMADIYEAVDSIDVDSITTTKIDEICQ